MNHLEILYGGKREYIHFFPPYYKGDNEAPTFVMENFTPYVKIEMLFLSKCLQSKYIIIISLFKLTDKNGFGRTDGLFSEHVQTMRPSGY